jgi:hypothetical protein
MSLGLDWFKLTCASFYYRALLLKFPGTSVPIYLNPSALDDKFDHSKAPYLFSIVIGVDDIDFDIDVFVDNNISMEPVKKFIPSRPVEFEALNHSVL